MRCPIPRCKDSITENGMVCSRHGVQIWAHVETVRDKSGFRDEVKRQRDRMERQAEENARAVAATRAHGWIYFIELDEKIKVGWTSDLEQRMRAYPPHAKFILKYPGSRADERDLHRTLKLSRVAGREWYARTPQVLEYMRNQQLILSRQYAEEAAARGAHLELTRPKGVPAKRQPRKRQPRGQALVRAILDGTVT